MRNIVVNRLGGPEVLAIKESADPSPGPLDLVVEVAAAGVNFIDIYVRSGVYPATVPYTPGSEGAGRVIAVGSGVTEFSVGDAVAWWNAPGSYATQVLVPAAEAVAVPDGISLESAAALMLQGLTAHYLTTSVYPIHPGDTVLVHAGAGGVGLLLTQIARTVGGQVISTASTEEKMALSRAAGAQNVLNYSAMDDLATEIPALVKALTGGLGVRAAYDGVGQATFEASLGSLGRRGTLVLFGGASGQVAPFDLQRLNTGGSLYVTRPSLGDFVSTRAELVKRTTALFNWVLDGEVTVRIGARYSLEDAAEAHRALSERRTTGKVLLIP